MNTRKPLILLATVLLAAAFIPLCLADFERAPEFDDPTPTPTVTVSPTPTPTIITSPTPTPYITVNPTAEPTTEPNVTTNPTTEPTTNPTEQPTPSVPEFGIYALILVMSTLACGVLLAKRRKLVK